MTIYNPLFFFDVDTAIFYNLTDFICFLAESGTPSSVFGSQASSHAKDSHGNWMSNKCAPHRSIASSHL